MFLKNKEKLVCRSGDDYYSIVPGSKINLLSVEPFYDGFYNISYYKLNCEVNNYGIVIDCRRYSDEGDLIVWNHGYNSVYLKDFARLWEDVFYEKIPDILSPSVNN
jgi:hypothetical protein